MPLFEFHCETCDHEFELLLRSPQEPPRCPKCESGERLAKRFSVPASAQSQGGARSNTASLPLMGCGAPACCMGGGCASD